MKKVIPMLLTALVSSLLSMIPVTAADTVYELEKGSIKDTGENATSVVALSGASGGQVVDLRDAGDSVTVNVHAASAGSHTLTIRYCQPYDENGKYQNLLVNGKNAGQFLCSYTGENAFKTVSLSADLNAGQNTITIEGDWGWTYLDSLSVADGAAVQTVEKSSFSANPIISRNVPAYSGSGKASAGNDDAFYTAWESSAEDYLAYDLSGVPENQRQQILAVWYNGSTFDRVGRYITVSGEPTDYAIEINRAPGGSYPQDGWKVIETVKANTLSTRSHLLNMDGANWIRMKISGAEGGIKLNLDIHDASQGAQDSWIFYGDSITAGGMVNEWGTCYSAHVHALDSKYTPMQQNGGIGGISSSEGKESIDKWLSATAAHYVSIAYGTNDSWGNMNSPALYYANTKYMIDAILKAGKVPVLPKIPYASNPDVGNHVGAHNAMIDRLYQEYGDKIVHGPDFEAYFKQNPGGLSDDGVHPNADGYEAMRKLWAETMYENVYTKAESYMMGDVNADGTVSVADAVMLQKYLHGQGSLKLAAAADLYGDGEVDVFDLAMLKRMLLQPAPAGEEPAQPADPVPTEPPAQAYSYDPAKQYAEYPASYQNAIPQAGRIVKETYNGINGTNSLNVYLPYGYDENKQYNVFYFMHGMWDDENSLLYKDNGEMQRVFDNMIQNGDIEPMIVVTPTFNKTDPEHVWKEVRESVIPFIEGKYATYAKSTSTEDLRASRMHRAYGGFSMGSVSTWATFENCVDIIAYFMPLSGAHHWGSGNADPNALVRAAEHAGLRRDQYFIMTATGTSDFAVDPLSGQVEAMKRLDQFAFTSDFSKGNFWYILVNGGQHDWYYVRQYVYNCLPFFFRQ